METSSPTDPATERLREMAERFQRAWQTHSDDPQAIDLAAFLPPAEDELRVAALVQLVPLDLAARWQNGIPLSLEDYIQRFPELGPLDRVAPSLIADEYRIRAQFGVVSPHSVLRQRFPNQFPAVERLIQTDPGRATARTIMPKAAPTDRPHEAFFRENSVVGDHYRLNKLLGRGGFGEVWHATDLRGDIPKAIKILTRSADSEEAQKEFESLNIIKSINHPCLLRTESYFVEKDRLFIVLELADCTLRDVLKTSQTESRTGIRSDELLAKMKHAAEGLDYLHKRGILHRDIKPENILVVGDYGKVADFGLAKEARNKQSTQADFAGTVVYSAPETWDGRVTTRSDQYSLAATYFELRTGRVLFSGKTFQEVFLKHMQARPDLEPLPELEQDVLRQALSKKPEDRFPTCAAFVRALEEAVLASGSKVVASQSPAQAAIGTRKNKGKTTVEADSLATRVSNELLGTPAKWNEGGQRRSNRGRKRSRTVPIVMVLLLVVAGVVGGGYMAHANLEQNVRDRLNDNDFVGAVKAVDESNVLLTPLRPALREGIERKAIETVDLAAQEGTGEAFEKTALSVLQAFPSASKPADLLVKQGWQWVAAGEPGRAQKLTAEMIRIGADAASVKELHGYLTAAPEFEAKLQAGQFREALVSLPSSPPVAAEKLIAAERDKVRAAWVERAQSQSRQPSIEAKEKGLAMLTDVAAAFPGDATLKADLAKQRDAFAAWLIDQVGVQLAANDAAAAKTLLAKAETLAEPKANGIALKAAKLLMLIETEAPTPAIRERIGFLFADLINVEPSAPLLEAIVAGLVRESAKDKEYFAAVRSNLDRLPKLHPGVPRPAAYDILFTPPLSAAAKKLAEAQTLFDATKFAECKKILDELNVPKNAEVKNGGLALYARLLTKSDFTRDQLRALDRAIVDDPAVKPAFIDAMTKRLTQDWPPWPDNLESWKERVRDCDRADVKNVLVQAIKNEGLLETGGRAEPLAPAEPGELPFVTYVRARMADSESDLPMAAKLVTQLPTKAEWLKGPRGQRAAIIAQSAALSLTPEKEGRLRLFAAVNDADQAEAWWTTALALLGDPLLEKQGAFPWQVQLNAALAAACKTNPDFAKCKLIGEGLLKDPNFRKSKGRTELVLVHPAGFAKELAELRPTLTAGDLEPMLLLGEAQRQATPNDPALRSRQALLSYTKARILDRAATPDVEKIQNADKAAASLEPDNAAYRVAVARDAALFALARTNEAVSDDDKVKACSKGLVDSDPAGLGNATREELWPDLGRVRAILLLTLGRHSDWTKPVAKKAFQDAVLSAKNALSSNVVAADPSRSADISLVLAQAHEALGFLCRADVEKNFEEAARAFEAAAAREPRYSFQRGRFLYRWATDAELKLAKANKAKRDELLFAAVDAFEKLADVPDFSAAAEAGYWEALSHWDRINRISASPKAQKAFERSLNAAAKDPAANVQWAHLSLNGLTEMTRLQARNSPSQSAGWLFAVEPAWRTLENDKVVGKDSGFQTSSRDYQDLVAETNADVAGQYLKTKDLAKYRLHIDRAVGMKHTTKHATLAVNRAIEFKRNETALKLPAAEMAAIRQEAVAAVDSAAPVLRAELQKQLNAAWPQ